MAIPETMGNNCKMIHVWVKAIRNSGKAYGTNVNPLKVMEKHWGHMQITQNAGKAWETLVNEKNGGKVESIESTWEMNQKGGEAMGNSWRPNQNSGEALGTRVK